MDPVSQATNQAVQAGAQPLVLQLASKLLGKNEYLGYCQAFVERMTGNQQRSPTAISAWDNAQNKVQGTQGMQPGDLVYFSPNASNQNYGHTGIISGNNEMISATNSGVKKSNIIDWLKQTGQNLLGYIPQGDRKNQQESQLSKKSQQLQQKVYAKYNPIPLPTVNSQTPTMSSISQMQNPTQMGRISMPNILGS